MVRMVWCFVLVLVAACSMFSAAAPAAADLSSIFAQSTRSAPQDEGAVASEATVLASAASAPTRSSLFLPAGNQGLFAPLPARPRGTPASGAGVMSPLGSGNTPGDRLLSLIARAEAGAAGYDAVQYGARIRPSKPPTHMTLGEIYAWIDATPRQPHAIGRYQFIPPTLRRVAQINGFGPETRFTPAVQDALAMVLLDDAGLSSFKNGSLSRRQFMHNLARIWAGLPLPNGRSYYQGYAGNSATMTWAAFEGGMAQIWPVGEG